MNMLPLAFDFLLAAVVARICIPWLRDAVEVSRTQVTDLPTNDNEEAEKAFLALLTEAEAEVVMYDDGDTNDGSLYMSQEVVQAIKDKLREQPAFRVECVLNKRTGVTRFETELAEERNVRIRERRENPSRIHYKIIDGKKAYVSCHQSGNAARNRRIIDCTNALSRHAGHRPLALQRYFNDFEKYAPAG